MSSQKPASKEIAFYYPGPIWHGSDWIKTLILFFDGIGILLPNYMRGKLEHEDPATAIPLMEKGLLHVLEPEKIVDKKATKRLGETMAEMIKSGALDKLPKDIRYHEISYSRLGGSGDEKIARDLFQKLKASWTLGGRNCRKSRITLRPLAARLGNDLQRSDWEWQVRSGNSALTTMWARYWLRVGRCSGLNPRTRSILVPTPTCSARMRVFDK